MKPGSDNGATQEPWGDGLIIRRNGEEVERLWQAYTRGTGRVPDTVPDIVYGWGSPMQYVIECIQLIAPLQHPVLVLGPSGAGKELVCRALHERSGRCGPFVTFNCALSAVADPAVVQAFFFGIAPRSGLPHVPPGGRRGLFEAANDGTVLLDELHHLQPEIQAMLLRFIEEGCYVSVTGEYVMASANIRLLLASNRDLAAEVRAGRFLSDLHERVKMLELAVPNLQERLDDFPVLLRHFLKPAAGRPPVRLGKDLFQALLLYAWPGNVRELKQFVEVAQQCLQQRHPASDQELELNLETLKRLPICHALKSLLLDAGAAWLDASSPISANLREDQIVAYLARFIPETLAAAWQAIRQLGDHAWKSVFLEAQQTFRQFLIDLGFELVPNPEPAPSIAAQLLDGCGDAGAVNRILLRCFHILKAERTPLSRGGITPAYALFDHLVGVKHETLRKRKAAREARWRTMGIRAA